MKRWGHKSAKAGEAGARSSLMHWFREGFNFDWLFRSTSYFCLVEPFVKGSASQKAVDVSHQSGCCIYIVVAQQKQNLIAIYLLLASQVWGWALADPIHTDKEWTNLLISISLFISHFSFFSSVHQISAAVCKLLFKNPCEIHTHLGVHFVQHKPSFASSFF